MQRRMLHRLDLLVNNIVDQLLGHVKVLPYGSLAATPLGPASWNLSWNLNIVRRGRSKIGHSDSLLAGVLWHAKTMSSSDNTMLARIRTHPAITVTRLQGMCYAPRVQDDDGRCTTLPSSTPGFMWR
jgi:hypothetical protein